MKNSILCIFFIFLNLNIAAQELEINAKKIQYDNINKITIFEGNVESKDDNGNQIFSEYAKYNKVDEIIETVGPTKIITSKGYKILSSSSEISGAVYIPDEPQDESYKLKKEMLFKFNDLQFKGSFLALRLEGDKASINERIKELTKELELKKLNNSVLDVYQSTLFWKKINNLELFEQTKNNLLRAVIPPSEGHELMKYLENKYKYYVDWCGSLYWIEVQNKKSMKISEIKKLIQKLGGYLTIIKTSHSYDYEEGIFTVDDTRLLISEKIKKSFDPKRIFNPGKMYRGI